MLLKPKSQSTSCFNRLFKKMEQQETFIIETHQRREGIDISGNLPWSLRGGERVILHCHKEDVWEKPSQYQLNTTCQNQVFLSGTQCEHIGRMMKIRPRVLVFGLYFYSCIDRMKFLCDVNIHSLI